MSTDEVDEQSDDLNEQTQEKMGMLSRLFRLNPLSKGDSTEKPPKNQEPKNPTIYYGVYIPCDSKIGQDEGILHVYTEISNAIDIVKKYKKARFKSFKNHQEAVAFALQGTEPHHERDTSINNSLNSFGLETNNMTITSFTNGEKPSQFKGPKPPEMIQFRKAIEAGNLEHVKKTVWENPRYLVSNGDTPSILQEGPRFNALHVAVKAQNLEMCNFLLTTISDLSFVQLLYGDDNMDSCKERAEILLDLYLNTPDKGINETPLHFAVKFGAKDIVDLLVSYPQCNRTRTNKFGEQPKDVICQRTPGNPELIKEIASMLQERFYVPVLHSEDDSKQPEIGEPFSPGSPLNLNKDPVSPRLEIRAFAGPMNKVDAATFRRKWKTPPRTLHNSIKNPLAAARFRLQDIEKGLEKVGRNLAQQLKISWKEYWPFLDTFTDIASVEGLGLLEDYLRNKFANNWNSSSNESMSSSLQMSPKTPTERIMDYKNTTPKSYKSGKNVMEPGLSPMSDLCLAFKSFSMNDNVNKFTTNGRVQKKIEMRMPSIDTEEETIMNSFTNPGLNPYLCIEKSCQVFAKRLNAFLASTDCNTDQLKTEIKHLQQTIASYMDDPRFHTVDFHLIHCRVAQIVAEKLLSDDTITEDLTVLKLLLKDISQINLNKGSDSLSSDEEEPIIQFRPLSKSAEKEKKKDSNINVQIKCLAKNILKWLSEPKSTDNIKVLKTEDECIDAWSNMSKCNCLWQTESFLRNCRKNSSMKRNQMKSRDGIDILSSSPKSGIDHVIKRLVYDQEHETDKNCTELSSSPRSVKNNSNKYNYQNQKAKIEYDEQDNSIYSESMYDSDGELYLTPSSVLSSDDESSEYEDTYGIPGHQHDVQSIDVYIHGTKPMKTDKSVFDAIMNCDIDPTKYPYVYRWRHTIQLYSPEERESWPPYDPSAVDDLDSPVVGTFSLGHISNFSSSTPNQKYIKNIFSVNLDDRSSPNSSKFGGSVINPITMLTPTKNNLSSLKDHSGGSSPNMQTSKWMRVTGPNSPRSALFNKNYSPNVSLRF